MNGPENYTPKRGGAPQTWKPTVSVRVQMTPDDASHYKARVTEVLQSRGEIAQALKDRKAKTKARV